MGAMSATAPPRPHRRALTQLLLGLGSLLVIGIVLLIVLTLRLADARAPLAAARQTGTAHVVASGQKPDGRGVSVTIEGSPQRTGTLVLAQPQQVPAGATVAVRYDPDSPVDDTAVYATGDAAYRAVQDVVYGLVLIVLVLVVAAAVTGLRVLTRRRLRAAPPSQVTATRMVSRRGLTVRSWLELQTSGGPRWLPVHWSPELAHLAPGGGITLLGDPMRRRLVLPVIDGAEVWPSGRLHAREPRGELLVAEPGDAATEASWGRQFRSDVAVLIAAPLLGLLWSYVNSTGVGSFVVATLLTAGVLFWLAQLFGSDPAPPPR